MKTRFVLPNFSVMNTPVRHTLIDQAVQCFSLTQLLFVFPTLISMRGFFGEFYSDSIEACVSGKSMGL
jgi:hypothetical protein